MSRYFIKKKIQALQDVKWSNCLQCNYQIKFTKVFFLHDFDENKKDLRVFKKLKNKKEKPGLTFHLKSGDYFGTLATILDFLRQEEKKSWKKKELLLRKIRNELLLLQKDYEIKRKNSLIRK